MARHYTVGDDSMTPTLKAGDDVAICGRPVRRGDLVLYKLPSDKSQLFIKRVIGLPGDSLEIRRGRVLIDGKALAEPYLARPGDYSLSQVKVADGNYFVLGDNRNASFDSHIWGTLPRANIVGARC